MSNSFPHRDASTGQAVSGPSHPDQPHTIEHVDTSSGDRMKAAFQRAPLTDGLARLSSEERDGRNRGE